MPEFERILKQLEEDSLPKFETRFKQLLHENTINQIALFQAKLKQAQDIMKQRIDQINSSLSAIDYNEGRYIRLEYEETFDSEIKALFPLRLPLKKPKSSEINQSFAEISNWIQTLKRESKLEIGCGYELEEKSIVNRQSGGNMLPTHAVILTVQDALRLLRKQREADQFLELSRQIISEWSSLSDWISRYPHKVMEAEKDWQGILAVLRWLFDHPRCGLYLRQLDIHGIDTKFIERRKGLLTELLDIILPESSIDQEAPTFESRFGLRTKPTFVRFRLLDHKHFIQGMSDFTVPIEQFEFWNPPISRVFITENEINGLCFPDMKEGLVIFKFGYGIDILKNTEWLKKKEIYYWGDLDTHGFAIFESGSQFSASNSICNDG